MKKFLPIIIIVAVIFGATAFYSGMLYGQSKKPVSLSSQGNINNFRNLTPEQRQQMMQSGGFNNRSKGANRQDGANFTSGEVISKDDKSLTVKLRDGGSKIIFYSDTTQIMKLASSTMTDLNVGETISANGTANSDGSITAQSIQVRPNFPEPPVGSQLPNKPSGN